MSGNGQKDIVLAKISGALEKSTPLPFPGLPSGAAVFPPSGDDLSVVFAEAFTAAGGMFSFCEDVRDLKTCVNQLLSARGFAKVYSKSEWAPSLLDMPIYGDLASCDASVTGCECLVARLGSLVLTAAAPEGRTGSVYAPVHICIANARQVVYDIRDAMHFLQTKYNGRMPSSISFATGPSRTADIEKTLVTGVHGPKEVFCFLTDGTFQ